MEEFKQNNNGGVLKKVLISGPLLSNSGYGVHSRQIFQFLSKINDIDLYCNILDWGNCPWHLSDDYTNNEFSQIINKHIPESQLYDIRFDECFSVNYPAEWVCLGKKNIGITAGVETNLVPASWLSCIDKMNTIIVPSAFTKKAFSNTFSGKFDSKIKVVPEYFYDEFLHQNSINVEVLNKIKESKKVLIVGQITSLDSECDRKNIINSIESSYRILSNIDDTCLVLKLNYENNSKISYQKLKKIIKPIIDNLKLEVKNKVPVYLIHGNFKPLEMKYLYENVSVLLSLSKGEGFGLTLLEAAACGTPIIATDYSAYTEFLKDSFLKVDYTLDNIPSKKVSNIFVKNSKWANFKNKSLHQTIDNFFNNIDKHNNIANNLKFEMIKNFNKEVITEKFKKCLQ